MTHLTLGKYFKQTIKNVLPPTVKYLTVEEDMYDIIKNIIPSTVTNIIPNYKYFSVHPGTYEIPANVTRLIFEDEFNQKIKKGQIPQSGVYLIFGREFNQNIKSIIPTNVTHLTFGDNLTKT